jgi:Fur family transcriptional regulator, ferric uptake regulator
MRPESVMAPRSEHTQAEDRVRRTGARVTRARVEVLATLLAAAHALTHHEIEERVGRVRGIDRVTIYRVLEWLTVNGLAHRIAGDDRVWRYNAEPERAHRHAHFQCSRCKEVTCLDEFGVKPKVRLPAGFRSQEVDLTVRGVCAPCTVRRRARAVRSGNPAG